MAMYGYLRLCRAMLGCIYTLLLVTIIKPLYDAYTTYLPDFLSLCHPNHFVVRAQTIETSSLPSDSSRPLFKQIELHSFLSQSELSNFFVYFIGNRIECNAMQRNHVTQVRQRQDS